MNQVEKSQSNNFNFRNASTCVICLRNVAALKASVTETIHDLETKLKQPIRSKLRGRNPNIQKPPARRARTIGKAAILLAVLAASSVQSASASQSQTDSLTSEQANVMFDEANQLYGRAYDAMESAPEESKDLAGRSSQKYQLLVASATPST